MITEKQTVDVIIPDEGKALRIKKNNKLVMYMTEPYYKVPGHDYEVDEVDIEVASQWLNMAKVFNGKFFNKKLK